MPRAGAAAAVARLRVRAVVARSAGPAAAPFQRSLVGARRSAPRDAGLRARRRRGPRVRRRRPRSSRSWAVPETAHVPDASAPDGRVVVGSRRPRRHLRRAPAHHVGGFAVRRRRDKPADVTAVTAARRRRSSSPTRRRGSSGGTTLDGTRAADCIGDQNKTSGVHAAEPEPRFRRRRRGRGLRRPTPAATGDVVDARRDAGRRRSASSAWRSPEDFVGCCNPVNVAVTPDGSVVTAEKMIARVKVFEHGPRAARGHRPRTLRPDVHAHPPRGRLHRADPRGAIPCAARSPSLPTVGWSAASSDSSRRQFIDRTGRVLGLPRSAGPPRPAGASGRRRTRSTRSIRSSARACDLCRTSCVLSLSAVKAVNDFAKCGYCSSARPTWT